MTFDLAAFRSAVSEQALASLDSLSWLIQSDLEAAVAAERDDLPFGIEQLRADGQGFLGAEVCRGERFESFSFHFFLPDGSR